jgi:hypothetical protein
MQTSSTRCVFFLLFQGPGGPLGANALATDRAPRSGRDVLRIRDHESYHLTASVPYPNQRGVYELLESVKSDSLGPKNATHIKRTQYTV